MTFGLEEGSESDILLWDFFWLEELGRVNGCKGDFLVI